MRASLKRAVASGIGHAVDLDRRVAKSRARYVLAYHRVIDPELAAQDHVHDAMWVSPQTFERQLRWMLGFGEIVDYRRLLDFTAPADHPLFALTFDDGWIDTYANAAPMMESVGVTALTFLVSDAVETGRLFWTEDVVTKAHRLGARDPAGVSRLLRDSWPSPSEPPVVGAPGALAEQWVEVLKLVGRDEREQRISNFFRAAGLDETPISGCIMTWDDARAMASKGFTFGSHTHTHQILKGLDEAAIELELNVSRSMIEARLGSVVDSFCYPNARFSGREGTALERCGYRYGFRIDGRAVTPDVDPHYVPRFIVSEHSASNHDQFRLYLLAAPGFAGVPHDPRAVP